MSDTVDTAILAKLTWKQRVMEQYAEALLLTAVQHLDKDVVFFNNDDVPDVDQPGDKTTVGAVIRQFLTVHLIEPWYGSLAEFEIHGGMRRSSRPECHGHRNQLYTLTSRALAEEWLRRRGRMLVARQEEFAFA
jgi:hypothetical protein